jgi:hypothetical protein
MKHLLSSVKERLLQPKWRHGSLGTLLMLLGIVVAVLINVALQSAEDTYGLSRDMSFNHYATTGETTKVAISQLENDVELYLLYQNGEENSQLLEVLQRYGVLSDRVTVLPTDINRNPGILTRFTGDLDTLLGDVHRVQLVPQSDVPDEAFRPLNPLRLQRQGRLCLITLRGERETLENELRKLDVMFMEFLPLSLEEVFILEMEGEGYAQ